MPQDLGYHNYINLRFPTYEGFYAWEFEGRSRAHVRVGGQLTVNDTALAPDAAMDGLGIAYLPEDQVLPLIEQSTLVRALEDWCPRFPAYDLYHPSRASIRPALPCW